MADGQTNQGDRVTLGGYEILSKLGQGGMGSVYKARQMNMDRIVALKVLPQSLARDKKYVARFLREARSAAALDHPGIVQAIDAGEANGYYYFAMEFVDGTSLGAMLDEVEKLPEQRSLEITREVAKALDFAHQAGLVHRDIKPDNILISKDGKIKLADLGLAREAGDSTDRLTQTGAALGTPAYIAPEQVRGQKDIDGRCDIYSLGGTLYHMLTGSTPYSGGTGSEVMAKHLSAPVPNPRRANPKLSIETANLVQKMLSKEPKRRPSSADAVVNSVDRILRGNKAAPETPERHAAKAAPRGAESAKPAAIRKPGRGDAAAPSPFTAMLKRPKVYLPAACGLVLLIIIAVSAFRKPADEAPTQNKPAEQALSQSQKIEAPRTQTPSDQIPAEAAQELQIVKQVEKWAADNPDKHQEALGRYTRVLAQMRDPAVRRRVEADIEAIKNKYPIPEPRTSAIDESQREAEEKDYLEKEKLVRDFEKWALENPDDLAEGEKRFKNLLSDVGGHMNLRNRIQKIIGQQRRNAKEGSAELTDQQLFDQYTKWVTENPKNYSEAVKKGRELLPKIKDWQIGQRLQNNIQYYQNELDKAGSGELKPE